MPFPLEFKKIIIAPFFPEHIRWLLLDWVGYTCYANCSRSKFKTPIINQLITCTTLTKQHKNVEFSNKGSKVILDKGVSC